MNRLTKLPVIGRLLRVASAFVRAPERFDALFEQAERQNARLDRAEAGLVRHDAALEEVFNGDDRYMNVVLRRLCNDGEFLKKINYELSAHPIVWGDPGKLHIADSAAVFTCLFNTNSGSITVGEHTFAGSRVSILAGSHDSRLTGLLRRDAELTEGCDIHIGNGVWLASNSTLLGPCTVGDNAVIAAGAVVTPGTHVPANTIYGGVPAKKIADLDGSAPQDLENPSVLEALERGGGLLFAEGWSDRQRYWSLSGPGHWLTGETAVLFCEGRKWTLYYALEDASGAELVVGGSGGERRFALTGGVNTCALDLPTEGEGPQRITFQRKSREGRLFVRLVKRDEEKEEPGGHTMSDMDKVNVDVRQIMDEIKREIREKGLYDDLPAFDQITTISYSNADELDTVDLKQKIQTALGNSVVSADIPMVGGFFKRLYKKLCGRAIRCSTYPLTQTITEANMSMVDCFECAVSIIERQQAQIEELDQKLESIQKALNQEVKDK